MSGLRFGLSLSMQGRGGGRARYDIYVDSVNGDDGNDGLSEETAFATIDAALAVVSAGERIGLARGQIFAPFAAEVELSILAFGEGAAPMISATSEIPAEAWQPDPDYTDVYFADVTHSVPMVFVAANPTGTAHPGLWTQKEDWTNLTRISSGATIADRRAATAALAGSYTVHAQGSTVANTYSLTGNYYDMRYYIHLPDGADPRVSSDRLHHAEHQTCISVPTASRIEGIAWGRTAHKDACLTGLGSVLRNVEAIDVAVHGGVGLAALIDGYTANARGTRGADGRGVGGWVWYRANANEPPDIDHVIRNFNMSDFEHFIYFHGSEAGYPVIKSISAYNGVVDDGDNIVYMSSPGEDYAIVTSACEFENIVATNVVSIGLFENASIRNLIWTGKMAGYNNGLAGTGESLGLRLRGDVTVEDSELNFVGAINRLYGNDRAKSVNDDDDVSLTFSNVSVSGYPNPPDDAREAQVNMSGWTPEYGILIDINPATFSTTMFSDRAGTVPAVIDGPIGRINLGGGLYYEAVSDAARATLKAAGGLYWLEADGRDDAYLLSASIQPKTIGSAHMFTNEGTTARKLLDLNGRNFWRRTTGGVQVIRFGNTVDRTLPDATTDVAQVLVSVDGYVTDASYINGAVQHSGTGLGGFETGAYTLFRNSASAVEFFEGRLYRLIASSQELGNTLRQRLESDLSDAAGL